MKFLQICLWGILGICSLLQAKEGLLFRNEQLGIETVLPKKDWVFFDQSMGNIKVFIYTPENQIEPRFALILLPANNMDGGMQARAKELEQSAGKIYRLIALEQHKLGNKNAQRLTYHLGKSKIVEYGLIMSPFFLIVQVAAPIETWEDKKQMQALNNIFAKFKWVGSIKEECEFDLTSPKQIRQKKQQLPLFSILSHKIFATIVPSSKFFSIKDTFVLKANHNNVQKFSFYFSLSDIDNITSLDKTHKILWRWEGAKEQTTGNLFIEVTPPLKKNEKLKIVLEAHTDNFYYGSSQNGFESTWGAISSSSSFSTYIYYYPTDRENKASIEAFFEVPKKYTVVCGGNLAKVSYQNAKKIFHYQKQSGKSSLPFGFAIANYQKVSAKTPLGLQIEVYGLVKNDVFLKKQLQVWTKNIAHLEKILGPCSRSRLSFVYVQCKQKDMVLSIPGIIFLSGIYWQNLQKHLSLNKESNTAAINVFLALNKDLALQWVYNLDMETELKEGIAKFSSILSLEKLLGPKSYRKRIRICKENYLVGMNGSKDFAIAHPQIYQSNVYRNVVYEKMPVVLDLLRNEVGEKIFFATWKKLFVRQNTGYNWIEKKFSKVSQKNLQLFFSQWFFQAGYPLLQLQWRMQGQNLFITIRQQQKVLPFELKGTLLLVFENGKPFQQDITLQAKKENTFIFAVDQKITQIHFDPEKKLLWRAK